MKAYDEILSSASALSASLIKKASSPVDAKTIANNIDEVLAMDDNWKFEGLFVYIIEEHMFYSFQGGITNDCFKPIGGAGGASTADAVEYVNDTISSATVEEALNKLISDYYYVKPSINSFTATPNGGIFEVGHVVSAPITFNWNYNKDITTQTLTDCTLADETVRTATYNTDITANKTFTLSANDGKNNVSKSISYTFVSPYYVGVSDTDILDETGIKALTKKVEVKGNKTISYTNSQNYMVFAYPSSYGTIKKVVDINGFDVTSSFKLSNVTVNSVNYNVYVSNKVTGTFKMTFSI